MLSLVVYGRNDQHGYNLHRRAALSINALAEVLTAPDDEMLFVDVGSADNLPTFPEAIDDLLTDQARARLRVIRVRPGQLAQMGAAGRHIPEGMVRNIGARRANTSNEWVLFTNTDVLLVEPAPGALHDALATLKDGFYHAPRYDVPNYLWEMFPRQAPGEALSFLREHGERLGLMERVYTEALVMFDNPGDFQLARRSDIAAIGGFDESMRRPFHVDSNFAARMRLHAGDVRPFTAVACFHCDHSRQITRMSDPGIPPNDPAIYVHGITAAQLPAQMQNWGAADYTFEEIRIPSPRERLTAFLASQSKSSAQAHDASYSVAAFNDLTYDPQGVSHYITDRLFALAPDTPIAWIGADRRLIEWTQKRLSGLGRKAKLLLAGPVAQDSADLGTPAPLARLLNEARGFVFAFGAPELGLFRPRDRAPETFTPSEAELAQLDVLGLLRAVAVETLNPAASEGPFVIANAINNEFEGLARQIVAGSLAPFGTRLRDGRFRARKDGYEVARDQVRGAAGVTRELGGYALPAGLRGVAILNGSAFDLAPGEYKFTISCDAVALEDMARLPSLGLEVIFGDTVRASKTVQAAPAPFIRTLSFTVTAADLATRRVAPINIRVHSSGRAPFFIRTLRIDPVGAPHMSGERLALAHRG